MEVSSSGKRKLPNVSPVASNSDSDSDTCVSNAKIVAKDFASQGSKEALSTQQVVSTSATSVGNAGHGDIYPGSELKVVISGEGTSMRRLHPTVVHRALFALIGEYEGPRPLRSGDLLITCKTTKQVKALLESGSLSDRVSGKQIPIKSSLYPGRPYRNRAVISGVPLAISDSELVEELSNAGVSSVKRLKRKGQDGYLTSLSVLLHFHCDKIPDTVSYSYLRFRTRPYNPPPLRCFRCNRFGHSQGACRGQARCSKCGGIDHEHSSCTKDKFCINCKKSHSAAYGGCSVYKTEAKLQIIKERTKVSHTEAKVMLISATAAASLPTSQTTRTFSQVLTSQSSIPPQQPLLRRTKTPIGAIRSKHTISAPAPNQGDLQHLKQPPLIANTQSKDTAISPCNPSAPPTADLSQLLSLLVRIVEFTMDAVKSGQCNALEIVSRACLKHGFSAPVAVPDV